MPDVSQNQLITTTAKACIGAGVARGVAEDMGFAIAALPADVLDTFIPELCAALQSFRAASDPNMVPRKRGADFVFEKATVLNHGPGLVDMAMIIAGDGAVVVERVDHPILLKALVDNAALQGSVSNQQDGTHITFQPNARLAPATQSRAHMERGAWAELLSYAHATMVPNDAASQADAGAGASDND